MARYQAKSLAERCIRFAGLGLFAGFFFLNQFAFATAAGRPIIHGRPAELERGSRPGLQRHLPCQGSGRIEAIVVQNSRLALIGFSIHQEVS